MEISTQKYNSLKINKLSLSIGVFRDMIYDESRLSIVRGVMRHHLSSIIPLLQLATVSCGRALSLSDTTWAGETHIKF